MIPYFLSFEFAVCSGENIARRNDVWEIVARLTKLENEENQ